MHCVVGWQGPKRGARAQQVMDAESAFTSARKPGVRAGGLNGTGFHCAATQGMASAVRLRDGQKRELPLRVVQRLVCAWNLRALDLGSS